MIRSLLACLMLAVLAGVAPQPAQPAGQWIQLFNGKDLDGWTPKISGYPLGENFGDTFSVQDGLLTVSYDAYETFDDRFGHLHYNTPFSDYVIRVEYRFLGEQVPGGAGWARRNSGVMVHGQDPKTMRLDQDFPVCLEVQLLGGDGTNDRPTGNLCTPGTNVVMHGELDRRHCIESESETYHGSQWVTAEIEVRAGERIIHRINGKTVMEYQDPELDERDRDARTLIEARDGTKQIRSGYISLQSESHPVQFRRVALRVLGDG